MAQNNDRRDARPPRKKGLIKFIEGIPLRKQGTVYIALLGVLLVVAAAFFVIGGISRSIGSRIDTTPVSRYEYGEGYTASGYIARQEEVIISSSPIVSLTLSEGQKVSAGQTVAMNYQNAEAQARQQEIIRLEESLKQLEYAESISGATYDKSAMDASIKQALVRAATFAGRKDFSSLSDMAPQLKGMILRRSAEEGEMARIEQQAQQAQQQLSALRSVASGDTGTVNAPRSGYFSGAVDGYETVLTPTSINSLSVGDLDNLSPAAIPADTLGKLITSDTWYYVAAVPVKYLENLEIGSTVQMHFAGGVQENIPMRVSHIGLPEGSMCVVVFSCSSYVQEVTLLRKQSVDITFRTFDGLRVPKSAVRVDENGNPGVFVLESRKATWKKIDVLYDLKDSYIVKLDKSSTSNLWPEDELILNEQDITDGKVVLE